MSKFVRKEVRYRHEAAAVPLNSASHIQGETVAVGHTYHLDSDAQFKRDLEQSLSEIVKKRLQEAEDEAVALVQIAERTAESNAKEIADEILTKANAQAKEMVEIAQGQVDAIKEAAHETGFKTGFQEGYADSTAQVEQETVALLQSAHLLSENAYQAEKLVLKNYEKNAVAMIAHLSRKVLRRELTDSPETLLILVQQAVESLYMSGKIKVVINPQVLQELRAFSAVTEAAVAQMSRFEFIVDPLLDVTQVFIVGEEGAFDLSPDTQITHLIAALAQALTLPRQPMAESDTTILEESLHFDTDAEALQNTLDDPETVHAEAEILPEELEETSLAPAEEILLPLVGAKNAETPVDEADGNVTNALPDENTPKVKVFEFEELGNLLEEKPS